MSPTPSSTSSSSAVREVLRGPALPRDARHHRRASAASAPSATCWPRAKAGDAILAVDIPPAADKLRRLMNLGQIIQSHALSFFHLSAPDFLLGWDTRPGQAQCVRPDRRQRRPGPRRHPAAPVRPGDHRDARRQEDSSGLGRARRRAQPLTEEGRARIRAWLPEASPRPRWPSTCSRRRSIDRYQDEVQIFGNFPSLFMGLVAPDGTWEHHGGKLRFVDSSGSIIADQLDPRNTTSTSAKRSKPWSYLKSPYYSRWASPTACIASGRWPGSTSPSRWARRRPTRAGEVQEARRGGAVLSSFLYHYARLIEILACVERIEEIAGRPRPADAQIARRCRHQQPPRASASAKPRAARSSTTTRWTQDGLLSRVNLIVATGQNNLAMNQTVAQIARHYVAATS